MCLESGEIQLRATSDFDNFIPRCQTMKQSRIKLSSRKNRKNSADK